MDEDVINLLEWLEEDHDGEVANIWGMKDVIVEPSTKKDETGVSDAETLRKIFNEEQLRFIQILVKSIVAALSFHRNEDDGVHPCIREELKKLDAKMRNHRHELGVAYSAKPEF
jgi:hypothetical protein